MTVESGRCLACGGAPHGTDPCPGRLLLEDSPSTPACWNCIPEPAPEWIACAYCGLPQAPGKRVCGYCGHLWKSAEPG